MSAGKAPAGRARPVYRTLVLVRHGQFALPSLGLTALGRRQAERTARRLRSWPVERLYCSTMQRARETADILARHLPARRAVRTHLLRECLPSLARSGRRGRSRATLAMVRRGREQAERAYRRYFRPPGRSARCDVLVSHGNLIRYLVGRVLGMNRHGWYRMGTFHCGITLIRITSDGRGIVDAYNDTGHLLPDMRTSGTLRDP